MTEVVVEELFASSALGDDPIFVAYLPDRPPVTSAEGGIEMSQSRLEFAFFEPGELGILTAHSHEKGDLSTLMDYVCRHFGVTEALFINVIGPELVDALTGFEWARRTIGGETMDCLEGEWHLTEQRGRRPRHNENSTSNGI